MRYEMSEKLLEDAIRIPRKAEEFLLDAGEAELRVLLFAAARASFEEAELFEALSEGFGESDLREALAFWRGAGVLCKGRARKSAAKREAPKKEAKVKIVSDSPAYTTYDLANAVEESPAFKSLVDFAEARLEKLLNRADLARLYSFVDYMGLPVDVVMLAIETCVKEGKKNLRYIEKLLVALADADITTYEAADEYFLRRSEYLSFEGGVRRLLGLGSRALTAAEKKMISAWKEEYAYTEEEMEQAYEKTVNAIAKPSVSYMNKVLLTLRGSPEGASAGNKTYDTSSRFAAAVARTKKKNKEDDS